MDMIERIRAGYCPYCGKGPFNVLALHTYQAHEITSANLRREFGLNRTGGILSPRTRQTLRDRNLRWLEENPGERDRLIAQVADGKARAKARGDKRPKLRPEGRRNFTERYGKSPAMQEHLRKAQAIAHSLPRTEAQRTSYGTGLEKAREWQRLHPMEAKENQRKATAASIEKSRDSEARTQRLFSLVEGLPGTYESRFSFLAENGLEPGLNSSESWRKAFYRARKRLQDLSMKQLQVA